ncbi:MAG: hypothetical protein HY509_04795 [Acidobacteria bacterium]|nr:hypothetical protein [Acidobacteriota bacterium]
MALFRYAFYFAAAFLLIVSLPAIYPHAGDALPLFLFYTPFFYAAQRAHEILPLDLLLHPLWVLGVGATFWAVLGALVGLLLKLWPFRSHLLLRVAAASAAFLAAGWILYNAAQLSALQG